MRKIILILVLVLTACQTQETIEIVDFNGLKPILEKEDAKTYVINFWATWCAPCIKELPYFETVNKEYSDKNVEVILISLDFPDQYEKRLLPYIAKNNLKSRIILLDDADANTWIQEIDSTWSGAIPATIIYNNNERRFYEKSFTLEELKTEVDKFLK